MLGYHATRQRRSDLSFQTRSFSTALCAGLNNSGCCGPLRL